MTLKTGVEMTIKKHAPQIEKVISVDLNTYDKIRYNNHWCWPRRFICCF